MARQAVFSTRNRPQLNDQALLASADQAHCFFEEEAFDAEGRLRAPCAQAINKIGHALHDRDPVFDRFSRAPPWAELAAELGLARPLEVPAGTLVVFHGLLPHASGPNRSGQSRLAYTLHAVDANAEYSALNWLQRRPDFPARSFDRFGARALA